MPRAAKSIEELFPIIGYAKAGNLKAVQEWIDAGNPLNLPTGKKTRRRSPLQIAIERGFYTLAEMLLDGGADPKADRALAMAVECKRADIAEMLLNRGVPLGDVSFTDVCYTHDLDLIRLFLARGADPVRHEPFYHALIGGLFPLLGFFKDLLAGNPLLQPQADAVLAYYAAQKNPRGVGLMMWAGADPKATIAIECDYQSQTPLEVAAGSGSIPVLKAMRPERFPEILPMLVQASAYQQTAAMREYLTAIGAPINDCDDGSSSGLSAALHRIEWDTNSRFGSFAVASRVSDHIRTIDELLAKGAKFPAMEANYLRRLIWSMRCEELLRLIKVLHTRSAFPTEVLRATISTPKMRTILGAKWAAADALLNPPKSDPQTVHVGGAPKVKPPPTAEEMQEKAERWIKNMVRNGAPTNFLKTRFTHYWTEGEVRRRLKMTPDDNRHAATVMREVLKRIARRTRSADIVLEPRASGSFPQVEIRLHANATWPDVVHEVCELEDELPMPLTEAAAHLLEKLQTGPIPWISREKLAKQLRQPTYCRFELALCREIEAKRGVTIEVEERHGSGPGHPEEIKLMIVESEPIDPRSMKTVVNWTWAGPLTIKSRATVDRFRQSLIDRVVEAHPAANEPYCLFRVHTKEGLAKVLPRVNYDCYRLGDELAAMFQAARLPSALQLSCDLTDHAMEWWVELRPSVDWATALHAIDEERSRPTYEQRFGLGYDAARLLEWIESRRSDEMLGNWTPVVEPRIESEIGFTHEWPEDNIAAFIQMLVDEINAKTDYNLSLQPWNEQGRVHTRIKVVRQEATPPPDLKAALSKIGASHGLNLPQETLQQIEAIMRRASEEASGEMT